MLIKPANNDGPASQTRSKMAAKAIESAPPATRTQSKQFKSKLQQPTKVPNHLRPTKASAAKTTRQGKAHLVQKMFNNKRKLKKVHKKIARLENEVHQALAVMDKETDKILNYRNLNDYQNTESYGHDHPLMNSDDLRMAWVAE